MHGILGAIKEVERKEDERVFEDFYANKYSKNNEL